MRSVWHPQLSFLLCLLMSDHNTHSAFLRSDDGSLGGITQLTDWHTVTEPKNFIIQAGGTKLPYFLFWALVQKKFGNILSEFLQDASRSGKYAVTAETYASASVNCLKYLFRSHLGPPINLHHTPRNLARRRNSNWHWKRYKKLISGLPIVYVDTEDDEWVSDRRKVYYYDKKRTLSRYEYLKEYKICGERRYIKPLPTSYYPDHTEYEEQIHTLLKCENIQQQFERHQKYMEATRIGLIFLRKALPLSAPSNELVALLRTAATKSFSQRAVLFPKRLKECKAAIVAYLNRV